MKIIICGSMSFSESMVEIAKKLKDSGHDVILPRNADDYAESKLQAENRSESIRHKMEHDLIRDYYEEINNSDAILVVNQEKNNIKGYVGGNSFLELAFGHVLRKKIFLLNDIPDMDYSDEITAMQPKILNGNLSKIPFSSH